MPRIDDFGSAWRVEAIIVVLLAFYVEKCTIL